MANKLKQKKQNRYQTTVRIDKYEELKQIATDKKWSFNTALNDAIEFYLKSKKGS